MPPLPRGICSHCGASVPVRRNGDAREHIDHQDDRHFVQPTGYAPGKCAGSGKPVRTDPKPIAQPSARGDGT